MRREDDAKTITGATEKMQKALEAFQVRDVRVRRAKKVIHDSDKCYDLYGTRRCLLGREFVPLSLNYMELNQVQSREDERRLRGQ